MSKFALVKIEAVKGHIKFFKLERDGKCDFDEFEKDAKENFSKEINKIHYRIDLLSRGERLPETQYRILKGAIKDTTLFEVKSNNLRIYCFAEKHTGSIVVIGGYKINQKKDLNRFEGIIKSYLHYKEKN